MIIGILSNRQFHLDNILPVLVWMTRERQWKVKIVLYGKSTNTLSESLLKIFRKEGIEVIEPFWWIRMFKALKLIQPVGRTLKKKARISEYLQKRTEKRNIARKVLALFSCVLLELGEILFRVMETVLNRLISMERRLDIVVGLLTKLKVSVVITDTNADDEVGSIYTEMMKQKIKLIVLPHGCGFRMVNDEFTEHIVRNNRFTGYFDRFIIYNEEWKKKIDAQLINDKETTVCGYPVADPYFVDYMKSMYVRNVSKDEKCRIIYLSSSFYLPQGFNYPVLQYKSVMEILSLVHERDDIEITIRTPYVEPDYLLHQMLEKYKHDRYKIEIEDNLMEALLKHDIVLFDFTSSVIPAFILEKPVIWLKYCKPKSLIKDIADPTPIEKFKPCYIAENEKELRNIIEELIGNGYKISKEMEEGRRKFLDAHCYDNGRVRSPIKETIKIIEQTLSL